jgi:hypothetical protein
MLKPPIHTAQIFVADTDIGTVLLLRFVFQAAAISTWNGFDGQTDKIDGLDLSSSNFLGSSQSAG